MQIFDRMSAQSGSKTLHETVYTQTDGSRSGAAEAAQEHFTAVYVNGAFWRRLVCTPRQLPEMVLGRLYTEGQIRDIDEVERIETDETGAQVSVILAPGAALRGHGGESAAASPLANEVFGGAVPPPVQPIAWRPEWVFALTRYFEAGTGTPLFAANRSVHSAMLAQGDKVLYCCEDIGRHNAIDKAVGCALLGGVDLKQCILFSSGRLPTDMVAKVIRAGIPVLCAKAACTPEAAALAAEFDLALITRAQNGSFALQNSAR